MDWNEFLLRWIPAGIAVIGALVAWYKAKDDYWMAVARDARDQVAELKKAFEGERKDNHKRWGRAHRAFEYTCQRLMPKDPAGVEIARLIWDGKYDPDAQDDIGEPGL